MSPFAKICFPIIFFLCCVVTRWVFVAKAVTLDDVSSSEVWPFLCLKIEKA